MDRGSIRVQGAAAAGMRILARAGACSCLLHGARCKLSKHEDPRQRMREREPQPHTNRNHARE